LKSNRVCILGGTGFVGRHLTAHLIADGISCIIPSRHPQRHGALRIGGDVQLVRADLFSEEALAELFRGCDAVVNLIGILNEEGKDHNFQRMHVKLADHVVEACKAAGVKRLLHMSALNASEASGTSRYLRSKGEAENRTHTFGQHQIGVTSFRPSVIFGRDDSFFNRFAQLLRIPGPFPLACPDARFAPVYVEDVAEAFARSLDDRRTWGKHYELCGPRDFSLRELVAYTARQMRMKKPVIGLNDSLSRLQARMLGMLPRKPFSMDNYLSMQVASLCKQDGLGELGISATDIDAVVPYYLNGGPEKSRYLALRRLV
jgi:NADH dehydrogenase